jgi:hypothetical protein
VRKRTANEWRDFWGERGERELRELMGDLAEHTTRIATLLGSRAPRHAIAAELGRIKGTEPDEELAARIHDWFEQS